jgi:hypothetical protein
MKWSKSFSLSYLKELTVCDRLKHCDLKLLLPIDAIPKVKLKHIDVFYIRNLSFLTLRAQSRYSREVLP